MFSSKKSLMLGFASFAAVVTLSGCATHQQTGALLGPALSTPMCHLAFRDNPRKRNQCVLAAGIGASFAGSAIGRALDERDRARAEEASRRAVLERELAVEQALNRRNAEIMQQQQAELARARTTAEREAIQRRSAEAQLTAEREARRDAERIHTTQAWQGTGGTKGNSEVVGAVSHSGQQGCHRVREVAIVGGREIRQEATYCKREGGRLERVA